MSFGRYQFLSWARRGVARYIAEADTLGRSSGLAEERARIALKAKLNTGDVEQHALELVGPGDVTGINPRSIIRTEPLDGIRDYEPNLLPYVEFYDEDFPYRYTPASPASPGAHLRPWLALLVLKEDEFVDSERRDPLPSIQVVGESVLPPHDELHLWCHMHSNLPHEESQFEAFLDGLEEDLKTDPDGVYSRLLCPRRLQPRTLYHAFLVPSYETGRRAGLGQPIAGVKAQTPAWPGQALEFPVYHRWYFRTGQNFDFEYLAKQLKPRIMPDRVGVREMDCSRPAFVRADADAEVRSPQPPVLLLGGAVMAPDAKLSRFPPANTAQPFLEDIARLVNLNRVQAESPDEDPVVSVPFYGMHHATRRDPARPGARVVPTFDPASAHWYDELNRDPVWRVPAGLGIRVVQDHQERFMNLAWKQLGDVLEANRRMRLARFATSAVGKLYAKTLARKANESFVFATNPVARRVLFGDKTARAAIDQSQLTKAPVDSAFGRMTRRNTSLVRGLDARARAAPYSYDKTIRKTNAVGGMSADLPDTLKVSPVLENLRSFVAPSTASQVKVWSVQSNLSAESAFNQPGFAGGLPDVSLWRAPFRPELFAPPPVVRPGVGRVGPVVGRPTLPGAVTRPALPGAVGRVTPTLPTLGAERLRSIPIIDTTVAANPLPAAAHNAAVRAAYTEISARYAVRALEPEPPALDTPAVRKTLDDALAPARAYVRLVDQRVHLPDGLRKPVDEDLLPAMAYPDIPEPTYRHLVEIDKELLLPNLGLIENNTLSLLKTNQKFIEAYLVGLNYEMGRELLWREYPTDMRGSCFRQFWDVSGFVTPDSTPAEAETLKDIKPIHTWARASALGRHNARDPEGDAEQLVFVIRGDLLRKFPNTVIFAQKALQDPDGDDASATVVRTGEMTDEQYRKEIRFPLYQAEIAPDIKLLGFNLTLDEASGVSPTAGFGNDKRGWYFVLAEVPGEPRFGMDIEFRPNDRTALTWNDLSWENLPADTAFVRGGVAPSLAVPASVPGRWGQSAAHMAAILLQRPVMMAIHATEMLDVSVPAGLDFVVTVSLGQHVRSLGLNLG